MQKFTFFLLLLLLLSSCSVIVPINPTQTATATPLPKATSTPSPSPNPTLTPTATPTPQPLVFSPLKGFTLQQLEQIVSNPFKMPDRQWDDGHPGVDLAFYSFGDLKTMIGLPIQSMLAGTVAAIVDNRNPYGNMIIIETPLENIPSGWVNAIPMPTLAPTVVSNGSLQCKVPPDPPQFDPNSPRSLYLLYAHLLQPPTFKIGDHVDAGQIIGEVGNTGQSSGPHLHFETRIGPGSTRFGTIAHKDASATIVEQYNYCIWRISFWFQPMDPLKFLQVSLQGK